MKPDRWGVDPKDEATVDRLVRNRRKVYADTAIPMPPRRLEEDVPRAALGVAYALGAGSVLAFVAVLWILGVLL